MKHHLMTCYFECIPAHRIEQYRIKTLSIDIINLFCQFIDMARPLRIEYPGAWYHFTSRCCERNRIVKDDTNRKEFLTILKDSLEKYMVQLHGYVLMENHFHLILHTPYGNLARFAQRFNTAYTVYYKTEGINAADISIRDVILISYWISDKIRVKAERV
ncbi:MAG: transposase [Candidatus Scalindua sp.]|nr:transposase [Candidatus Scalindua sp.]